MAKAAPLGPGSVFTIQTRPPLRDVKGRFSKANRELLELRRGLVRKQGRRMKDLAVEEAPSRTGEFRRAIRWRSFIKGGDVGFTVTAPQPLATYIIRGTRAHPIVARNAKMLAFPWPDGPKNHPAYDPKSGLFFFYSVNHPGTKRNPFISQAYRRWLPGARSDLRKMANSFARWMAAAKPETKVVKP